MINNVKTDLVVHVAVRPFMAHLLYQANDRLTEKDGINVADDWDYDPRCLVAAAQVKLAEAAKLICEISDPVTTTKKLADALNFVGMTYDTVEQLAYKGKVSGD